MTDGHPPTRPKRPRRWLRRIIWVLVAAAVVTAGVGWWALRPANLTRIVRSTLAGVTAARVELAEARLAWGQGLQLTDLTIAAADPAHGEVFAVERVRINPSVLATLLGSPQAEDIELVNPTLYLTEDVANGRYLFQDLLRGDADDAGVTHLPRVTVAQGRLVFRELVDGRLNELGEMKVAGQLTTMSEGADEYRFVLRQIAGGPDASPTLSGTFNLRQRRLEASLDGFRFEQPQRFFLRHELRTWWDRLDPQGAFSTLAVAYDAERGWTAQLALEQASLNVPLGDYAPRMTDISGRMRVEGHSLVLDRLDGVVEGLRYRVSGQVFDLGEKESARFTLHAETDWFEVEPDPQMIDRLPAVARKYHERFQPAGQFQIEASVARQEAGGQITFNGTMRLREASGTYHKFPYPAHDVEGVVRFNREQIVIDRLEGKGPGDSTFAFDSGRIFPPGDGAQVQVALRAWNVPIDEALRRAMEPEHRQVLDLFFDDAQRAERVGAGLLDPSWSLGGVVRELHVTIDRPQGDDVPVAVTSTIDVAGLSTIYRHWPYPMTAERGQVTISPQRVDVDLQLTGPSGAAGRVVGKLDRDGDEDLRPDLHIEDAVVPLDDLLIASLPAPQNQWLADLHARGELRGRGRVHQPSGAQTGFALNVELVHGQATPYGRSFTLEPLGGAITIERHRLAVHELTGRRGAATLSIAGAVDWSADPLSLDLTFTADDLPVEPALLDLLPPDVAQRPSLAAMFETRQPEGVVDAELTYQRTPQDDRYTLTVEPAELSFELAQGRAAFGRMSGRAVIEPGRVRLDHLAGHFDDSGRLELTGTIATDTSAELDLTLAGETMWLGPTLRAILPPAVRHVAESLQLDGGLTLRQAVLQRNETGTTFDGDLQLIETKLSLGVEVEQLNGLVRVRGEQRLDESMPRIDLDLHANRLLAAGRLVRLLDVRLASSDDGRLLRVNEFLGSIYGGALVGEGVVELADPPRYRFDLTLEDVELGPFLKPEQYRDDARYQPHRTDEPSFVDSPQRRTETGLLSASLSIEARAGEPGSRVGRGVLDVREATLYNQPIPLAVLQALNLTLPVERSFRSASARYLIDGDTVLFDTIRFDAPSLAISGSGTLDWPTQALNLELVTRNPSMPDLGAMGEVLNKFKDELMAIRITGTLSDPRGRAVSFSGFRRSWDELFSGKAARGRDRANVEDRP